MIVLAIDLGGTKTALARVSREGEATDHRVVPAARSLEASLDPIVDAAADVEAVGIVVPGIYDVASGLAWCPNLWGDAHVPLRDALAARLRVPVAIDADRTGYVLGEAWLGAARGARDAVFVALGTGIGVGILSDGRVIRGARGIAGAAGWFALDPRWREEWAQTGCWEALAAGPGVARHAGTADAHEAVERARAGDAAARAAIDRAAAYSAMGIANLVSVLDPEVVVLGGGFAEGAGDLLLEPLRREVPRWAQPISARRCRIELSELGGRAGLLGAARLALDLLVE